MKTVRILLIATLLVTINYNRSAARNLPASPRNSAATMVYRLSHDDLRALHIKGRQPSEKMLHTFVKSFTDDAGRLVLERGNYLLVRAVNGQMHYWERVEDDLDEIMVLGGERPRIVVSDTTGGFISTAQISGWKWDARANCYTASRPKFDKVYELNNGGVYHYFTINKESDYYWREERPSWFSRQWSAIKEWFKGSSKTERWDGFIAFSKPKYRPAEMVRLKAYLTRNDKQYNEPVNLVLSRPSNIGGDTILAQVTPYRAGMYQFEFKLTEKFKLQLDRQYPISLCSTDGKQTFLSDYLWYEEYELRSLNFSATAKSDYLTTEPVELKLRAVDENNLPIYDGRVEITLTPNIWSTGTALCPMVFVADTLWHRTIDMEGFAEKTITIPDDVFPAQYTGQYQVRCAFMTADNERLEQWLSFTRNGDEKYRRPHEITPPTANLWRDTGQVHLSFDNPDTLPIWFRVLAGEKLVDESFGTEISRTYDSQKSSFTVQWWWCEDGYEMRFGTQTLPWVSENITMSVSAPHSIYPGQRVEIGVDVVDNRGRAVENADVTALAYTSKFDNTNWVRPLRVPLNREYKYVVPTTNEYSADEWWYNEMLKMEWSIWRERLGLDSLEFYRFLSPAPTYRYVEEIGGDMAEIVPFAVVDGEAAGVQVLYIDSQPYFVKVAGQREVYAFQVRPGYHQLRLRLIDREVETNISVGRGERLICSVDATKSDYEAGISVSLYPKNRRGSLTDSERDQLGAYMIRITSAIPYTNLYHMSVAEPLYILGGTTYAELTMRGGEVLAGPFPYNFGNRLNLYRNDSVRINWFDNYGSQFDYRVDGRQVMIFQRNNRALPVKLNDYRPTFDLRARPLTAGRMSDEFEARIKSSFTNAAGAANAQTDSIIRGRADCRLRIRFGLYAAKPEYLHPMLLQLVVESAAKGADTLLFYGLTQQINGLPEGQVALTVLFRDESYYSTTLNVKRGGTNYTVIEGITPTPADAISQALYASVRNRCSQSLTDVNFNYSDYYLTDDVSVVAVGYGSQLRMRGASSLSANSRADMALEEVVMKSYEAADMLAGQVAGLNIDKEDGGDKDIQLPPMPDLEGRDPSAGIRHNFSDDAFWQPRLTTNKAGHTSFEVTFPDDITQWKAQFIAIGTPHQTAQKTVAINSFLPLSARLSVPNFAIDGDSFNAIGKLTSYLDDTVHVEANGRTVSFARSFTEPLAAIAAGDSITLEYLLVRPTDGYSDGERRTIPVYPRGTLEAKGEFVVLDRSSHTFAVDTVAGKVTLHAEATQLGSLLAEIDRTVGYVYNCNEQMASKIKSLVARRRIGQALGRVFDDDVEMRKIILQLLKNRNSDGFWGWWGKADTEWWLSAHIIEALSQALEEGYPVEWDVRRMTSTLLLALQTHQIGLSDRVLVMLKDISAPVDYATLYEALPELPKEATLSQRLARLQTKATIGLVKSADAQVVTETATPSMLGGLAWSEPIDPKVRYACPSPEYGTVENTLTAYRILTQIAGTENIRAKIRLYLFEQRRILGWGNTYQTSRIIETILPDLYTAEMRAQGNVIRNSELVINGRTITTFPYMAEFEGGAPIVTRGEGSAPIYVTVYQQTWNSEPEAVSADFTVSLKFIQKGKEVEVLTSGEPVDLVVTVQPRAQASYIMVTVPIPAGCSYADHYQNWMGEIHREYFKEQVSIFVNSMAVGVYTYTVHLIPRYTGVYTLNPARAELMYFPTFFGRTAISELRIEK